ncbi:hypothetical protein Vadar_027315 [Vaccinium darrowii]|uniref:Uncharacterized protein n=1 Tax=Vaccinium darrowii TaxID=229202 RepID=A0ACB7Y9H1_9ERIC|nr:hypothetical protein Vadar_027315 [Vaccinium darrowii]
MELKVPQITIATAMMLCHRFYMRQSLAKNDWQTITIVSLFLACKAEETPRCLSDVAIVAYKLMYKWDPSASRRIKQRDVYEKQKEMILTGERLLLSTVAFDLNIEHPYKPLIAALKRLEISDKKIVEVAWNFVNDWLRTTLCLQYKPHYIAAGSLYLATKFRNVKLPSEKGKVWWMQFEVSPKQLEEVIQQMLGMLDKSQKQAPPPTRGTVVDSKPAAAKKIPSTPESAITNGSNVTQNMAHGVKSATSSSPESCIISSSSNATDFTGQGATVDVGGLVKPAISKCIENEASSDIYIGMKGIQSQTSDCGSANSVVEDGDVEPKTGESDPNSSTKVKSIQYSDSKIDVDRIRNALKRRRSEQRVVAKKLLEGVDDEIDSEAWIERELENGIELDTASVNKRKRL